LIVFPQIRYNRLSFTSNPLYNEDNFPVLCPSLQWSSFAICYSKREVTAITETPPWRLPPSLTCEVTWNCLFYFAVFSETLNTDGPAADINDTTESDDQSDDNEEDSFPALGDALTQLGLPEYVGLFESEEMDMETFVS